MPKQTVREGGHELQGRPGILTGGRRAAAGGGGGAGGDGGGAGGGAGGGGGGAGPVHLQTGLLRRVLRRLQTRAVLLQTQQAPPSLPTRIGALGLVCHLC